ncbi:MAG: hypothetical protein AB1631_22595 [Acidobacteriota bacterium]
MTDPQAELSLEKLRLENERLSLEIASMKRGRSRLIALSDYIPLLSVLVTIAGFGFGIYQYRAQQIENRKSQEMLAQQEREDREAQLQKDKDTAQRDFMKPLLEKQLSLYFEASSAVSAIATSSDPAEREKATNTFWRLYYGPLVVVETKEVSNAMQSFAKCLSGQEPCSRAELNKRSLALATSLQESMLKSWNLKPENFTQDKFKYD